MIGRLVVLAVACLLLGAQGAWAEDVPQQLCPGSAASMAGETLLQNALKAAYPNLPERRDDPDESDPEACVYPYQANTFGNTVVLFTLSQKPGEDCHGCGAKISADFLRRDKDRLVPIARHREFGESGSWGDLTAITPVRAGSDDGIGVEGGGTFQGETYSSLQIFIFRDGQARAISPENGIILSQSDCDAVPHGKPCTDISGTWKMEPAGRVTVSYRGRRNGRTLPPFKVVYDRRGDALEVTSGTPLSF
ncbi:hypothetical protein [Microvirga puerhi]|uniref:Lipoprotein n=1 Tax=Microvirga puerhi TaxID=2876078 RepID=A0ABS7VLY5_9HYPH|nr:hypothetical protein [Microvirga puerhi]MBZ6076095.1 hypothetical protein [Microvirga puerhi]